VSNRWPAIVVAVAMSGAIVGGVLFYGYQPGGPLNPAATGMVDVLEVKWEQGGIPLGLAPGFTAPTGSAVPVYWPLSCETVPGFNESCSTGNVSIVTPGFGLASTNTPATWYSGPSNSTFVVNATVVMPSGRYTGNLEIDLEIDLSASE